MALSAKKEKKLSLASSHEFEQDSHAHSSSSVDGGTGDAGRGAHPRVRLFFRLVFLTFFSGPIISTVFCLRITTINEMFVSAQIFKAADHIGHRSLCEKTSYTIRKSSSQTTKSPSLQNMQNHK